MGARAENSHAAPERIGRKSPLGLGRGLAAVRAHGLVGQLGLVALAHEQPPRAVALAVPDRRQRKALRQHVDRGAQLLVALPRRYGHLGEIGWHAAPAQVPQDALGAPALERALVLREALGEAGVVEVAGRLQLAYSVLDRLRLDPFAFQAGAELGDRAVARRDCPVGELCRPLALGARGGARGPVEREGVAAQAALSWTSPVSGSTPGGGPAAGSTTATGGPCPMPRTSYTFASISLALSGFSRR